MRFSHAGVASHIAGDRQGSLDSGAGFPPTSDSRPSIMPSVWARERLNRGQINVPTEPGEFQSKSASYSRAMAEITTRRQGEMIQAVFKVLVGEPEGLQAKEAIDRVEAILPPTEFERSTFPKNPELVRFPKLLRFSTINSVKAGWLRKNNGIWTITDEGIAAYERFDDPEELFIESRRLYREWKTEQDVAADDDPGDDSSDDTSILSASSLEEAGERAREGIHGYLGSVNPYVFQDLIGRLIEAMGYHLVWSAPKGPDGGLDFLAQGDPLGVNGPRIKGQVKRRSDKVSEEELRSFLSLIEPHDVGVYFSLAGFTSKASELSRRSSRRITLVDGDGLLDLWIEHYENLDETGKALLPLKPVYFLDAATA